jgi:hypothetical protein
MGVGAVCSDCYKSHPGPVYKLTTHAATLWQRFVGPEVKS